MKKKHAVIVMMTAVTLLAPMQRAQADTSIVLKKNEPNILQASIDKGSWRLSSGRVDAYSSPRYTGLVRIMNRQTGTYGTGFLIDRRTVLTASHVILADGSVVRPGKIGLHIAQNGRKSKGEAKASSVIRLFGSETTVIRLKAPVTNPSVRPMRIADTGRMKSLMKGTPLAVTGYPYTIENRDYLGSFRTSGYLAGVRPDVISPSRMDVFFTHMKARPGFSGGPLMGSDGRVYGIHTMGSSPASRTLKEGSYYEWGGGLLITKDVRRMIDPWTSQDLSK